VSKAPGVVGNSTDCVVPPTSSVPEAVSAMASASSLNRPPRNVL
jgi:hypothetical protein